MCRKNRGFTLIELLVVITIIGMLIGLLLPAVQSAREAGRRTQCLNNQHQISTALLQYEAAKGAFPGYVGEYRGYLPGDTTIKQRKISWFVAVLPYLDRVDLHDLWKDITLPDVNPDNPLPGTPTTDPANPNPIPAVYMRIAVCPNNTPPTQNESWLSYRANVGRIKPNYFSGEDDPQRVLAAKAIPAEAVFTDQYQDDPTGANTERLARVSQSFINSKDGTGTTLMLAENSASVPPYSTLESYFEGKWAPLVQNPGGGGTIPPQIDGDNIWKDKIADNALVLGFNWGGMDPADPNAANCAQPPTCTDNDGDNFSIEGGNCGPVDCNDYDATVNPGAVENCTDGIDNDCDGLIDNADFDCGISDYDILRFRCD
ncbi:MAG: DUF1559 family PulG-like putative transporter, partial [Thermoguttaceae bacterium]